jgi:hypothetical protein
VLSPPTYSTFSAIGEAVLATMRIHELPPNSAAAWPVWSELS